MKLNTKKGGIFLFLHLFHINRQVFYLSGLLWIIGTILLPTTVFASAITPQRLIELTNQERAKYELNLLTENKILINAALEKANDILKQQKFSHNFSDRKFSQWIKDQDYQYSIVGENLAVNFITSEGLFNAWLASPTHKQNVLHEDFQELGVAVVEGNFVGENTILVVELFAAPAVMAEQIISTNINNNTSNSLLPAGRGAGGEGAFSASNLAESYITNITNSKDVNALPYLEPIELSAFAVDKNKIINYFFLTMRFMAFYIAVMLLVILGYYYAIYFKKLIKKLGMLPYPIKLRRKENFTFYQKFMVKVE